MFVFLFWRGDLFSSPPPKKKSGTRMHSQLIGFSQSLSRSSASLRVFHPLLSSLAHPSHSSLWPGRGGGSTTTASGGVGKSQSHLIQPGEVD